MFLSHGLSQTVLSEPTNSGLSLSAEPASRTRSITYRRVSRCWHATRKGLSHGALVGGLALFLTALASFAYHFGGVLNASPLRDSASLNIGILCRWEPRCIDLQQRERARVLTYVRQSKLSAWRLALCDKNARRGHERRDWIGYSNCIHNPKLRPVSVSRHSGGHGR